MHKTPVRVQTLPHLHHFEGYEVVELPMTSEDRVRVRRRLTASDGREFAVALATGTVLHVGHALHVDGKTAYVVTAAPEDVLVVTPKTVREAAFVGHLIGNLHRDIDIADGQVVALWNAPLEAKLQKEGLEAERTQRPFKGKPPGEHSH
ncbi:urease accessory protein UreE [soil metagenome]